LGGLKACCVPPAGGAAGVAGALGVAPAGFPAAALVHPFSLPVIDDQELSIVVTRRPFCVSVVSHHWSAPYGLHIVTV
jgi:hypothetical protein